MRGFIKTILGVIFCFFYWLICVKLTSYDKNRLRSMGVETQEELDEVVRRKCEAHSRMMEEDEATGNMRRYPLTTPVIIQKRGGVRVIL
ncbi:hypothetical protein N0V84_001984 [Fusarium piperis]|uniref:Uncharacterized protein n=1 Tax=Fusarium piperis TaxID=1435070 RepID=A0A9W8WK45_9HYPO|nr:hypothetical protein N0V84_001984 [Fusarium piperis]